MRREAIVGSVHRRAPDPHGYRPKRIDRIVPASLHVLKTEPPHRTINEDGKPCWVRKIEGGPKYTVPRELVREPRAASVR